MLTYYLICLAYCFIMSFISYRKRGFGDSLQMTPALDSIVFMLLCWVLAPVDLFLTFIRLYKDAETSRRNLTKLQ